MTENTPRRGESRSEYVRRQREQAAPFDLEKHREQKVCDHRAHGSELVAYRKVNGDLVAYDRCTACGGRYNEYKVYSRAEVPHPEELPLVRDEIYNRPPCEVCGAFGTEIHHWAPREFFDWEAEHWPTGYLCRVCHARWHTIMREQVKYADRQKRQVAAARPKEGPIPPRRTMGSYRGDSSA